ncbi:MAG: PD-(D/E)XK nuclease family protein [bacterium]
MVSFGAELFAALEDGAVLITANSRLARWSRAAFDRHQRERGREVWPSAEILPLSAWLRRAWDTAMAAGLAPPGPAPGAEPLLLSPAQTAALWERIVRDDRAGRDLLRPAAAADLAARAWRMLADWQLELSPGEAVTEEAKAFLRWSRAWHDTCARQGWFVAAGLPALVGGWLAAGQLPAPPRALLAGFDEWTPAQRALLEALRGAGCAVEQVAEPNLGARAARVGFADAAAEMEAAALWARGLLEAGEVGSIAVVAPDLNALRGPLARIFAQTLAPGEPQPLQGGGAPFNISKGIPLKDYPLVSAALALLGMGLDTPPLTTLGRLLRSPFLAGAERELHQRALLDARLREFGRATLPLAAVIAAARGKPADGGAEARPWHAPLLAARLEAWREAFDAVRGVRQSPSAWSVTFAGLLQRLGWPGERPLDSTEFQVRERMEALLSDLAELEMVLPRMGYGEALARLTRLAAETEFQPEGGPEAQVQILGELEAGGMAFARLWVLGLHDGVWPRAPAPNPFLPPAWQRKHGLPRSSAGRELAYARRVTGRLLAAAGEVVVGWPRKEGDQPLRPSPAIAALPEILPATLPGAQSDLPSTSSRPPWPELVRRSGKPALETVADQGAAPLPPGFAARGGAALFKDQADCPFRAFALHRLHARPLAQPEPGMDARERGTLAHQAMEKIWARLLTQQALLELSAEALQSLVQQLAEEVVEQFSAARPGAVGPRLAAIERGRIARLALAGLEQEKQRKSFAVVAREQERAFAIGGIEVNTRIDRIDRVAGAGDVLIDYKTGTTHVKDWFGDRPEEPQLPLYCSSGDFELAGVAFFQLRRGETRFRGVESESGIFPGATGFDKIPPPPGQAGPADLPDAVNGWRATLEGLAGDFRRGDARVDPKRPGATCRYCELTPLCRVSTGYGSAAEQPHDDDHE